jgi:glutaredoxin 3
LRDKFKGNQNMQNVEIYNSDYCPFCRRAKALLTQKGISFEEYNVDMRRDLKLEMVERAGGRTSVPQIFIGETHVGGCDELFALESENKLDALLQA